MIKNLIIVKIQRHLKNYFSDFAYSMQSYKKDVNSELQDGMFLMILLMRILMFAKDNLKSFQMNTKKFHIKLLITWVLKLTMVVELQMIKIKCLLKRLFKLIFVLRFNNLFQALEDNYPYSISKIYYSPPAED